MLEDREINISNRENVVSISWSLKINVQQMHAIEVEMIKHRAIARLMRTSGLATSPRRKYPNIHITRSALLQIMT